MKQSILHQKEFIVESSSSLLLDDAKGHLIIETIRKPLNKDAYIRFSLFNANKEQYKSFIGFVPYQVFEQSLMDVFVYQFSNPLYNSQERLLLHRILHFVCFKQKPIQKISDHLYYTDIPSSASLLISRQTLKVQCNDESYIVSLTPTMTYKLFEGVNLNRFEMEDFNHKQFKVEFFPTKFSNQKFEYEDKIHAVVFSIYNQINCSLIEIPITEVFNYLSRSEFSIKEDVIDDYIICSFNADFNDKELNKKLIFMKFKLSKWLQMVYIYKYFFEYLKIQDYNI